MTDNPKQDVGAKKAPLELVPPVLMIAASAALANGAEKYGAYNYREAGVKASIYYAAALRHLSAWWDGEEIAEDSGVDHLAHVAACIAILLDTKSIGRMVDDRPPAGGASGLLAELDTSAIGEAPETDYIKRFLGLSADNLSVSTSGTYCGEPTPDSGYVCTRPPGHDGRHAAHGAKVEPLVVWDGAAAD
jgi:hypothetical protein